MNMESHLLSPLSLEKLQLLSLISIYVSYVKNEARITLCQPNMVGNES